ncbi:MAG: TSUP family transporter [Candidatus Coproplasma sp.]
MSFILIMLTGFVSGVFGGMGMGGGTVMIPALTLLLGIDQRLAQSANLISFLPMAVFALPEHKENGLLRTEGILSVIIPALITSVMFSLIMTVIPSEALRRAFGLFLIALAINGVFKIVKRFKKI